VPAGCEHQAAVVDEGGLNLGTPDIDGENEPGRCTGAHALIVLAAIPARDLLM
jgi:hypothetical protein